MKTIALLALLAIATCSTSAGQALNLQQQYMPTAGQKAALAGTAGSPGTGNKYVVEQDPNMLTPQQKSGLTGDGDYEHHYHSSDRARANHTGTQPRSTISNFSHGSTHTDPQGDPLLLGLGLWLNGFALDIRLGTSAGYAAAGANTVGLVSSSFTFGPDIAIGAGGTIALTPTWGTTAGTFTQGNDGRLLTQAQHDDLVAHPLRTVSVESSGATTVETWAAGIEFTGTAIGSVTRDLAGHVVVSIHDSGASTGSLTPHQETHRLGASDALPASSTSTAGLATLATNNESSSSKAVAANDDRLSDARDPTLHGADHAGNGTDPLPAATTAISGSCLYATDGESAASKAVQGNDSRLSNARTPSTHAASHKLGAADSVGQGTTSTAGLLQLASNGETSSSKAVAADDARLTAAATVQDEGTTQGTPGAVSVFNVVGSGVTASVSGATATFTVASATTATQGTVQLATDAESSASKAVAANDSRLGGMTFVDENPYNYVLAYATPLTLTYDSYVKAAVLSVSLTADQNSAFQAYVDIGRSPSTRYYHVWMTGTSLAGENRNQRTQIVVPVDTTTHTVHLYAEFTNTTCVVYREGYLY